MQAVDAVLDDEGVKPFQRPMHLSRKFWEAFGWSGPLFPAKEFGQLPGYEGSSLVIKAQDWYVLTYGEKLKQGGTYGYAPVKLGRAIWRVRAGVVFGQVSLFIDRNLTNPGTTSGTGKSPANFNVLMEVEDLTQGLVDGLSEPDLLNHLGFHVHVHENLQWLAQLPITKKFSVARWDYDASTSDLLAGRYIQSMWGSEQAVEKMIKGLLELGGTDFPKGGKFGHDLPHLGELLKKHHDIAISTSHLETASCSPKVRYNEEPATEKLALAANHAVLWVMDELRKNPKTPGLLNLASTQSGI
ncbi:hypothetical protein C5F53_07010 [Rhodoferax sp. TS-BS-61-7]|nr:hypothetical protein C5F53_07010 [Rhodoferax sp. TS-BS-61-7]